MWMRTESLDASGFSITRILGAPIGNWFCGFQGARRFLFYVLPLYCVPLHQFAF
jgi:hypothetical protein